MVDIATCVALFIVMIDNMSLNVALPTLSRELHASSSQLAVDCWRIFTHFLPEPITTGAIGADLAARVSCRWNATIWISLSPFWPFLQTAQEQWLVPEQLWVSHGCYDYASYLSILTNVFPLRTCQGSWYLGGSNGVWRGRWPAVGGLLLAHYLGIQYLL